MPYLETYNAFARFYGDKPPMQWSGLTKTKAKWRYHWLQRQYGKNPDFNGLREFGFTRDWQA